MKSLAVALFAILPIACLGAGFSYKPYDDLGTHDRVIVTNVTFDGLTSPSEVTNISQYVVSQSVSSPTNAVTKQTRVTVNGISGELSSNLSFSVSTGISGPYVRTVNGDSNDVTITAAGIGAATEADVSSALSSNRVVVLWDTSNHWYTITGSTVTERWTTEAVPSWYVSYPDGGYYGAAPAIPYPMINIEEWEAVSLGMPSPYDGVSLTTIYNYPLDLYKLTLMNWAPGQQDVYVNANATHIEFPDGDGTVRLTMDYIGNQLITNEVVHVFAVTNDLNAYVMKTGGTCTNLTLVNPIVDGGNVATTDALSLKADATNVIHFSDGQAVSLTGGVVSISSWGLSAGAVTNVAACILRPIAQATNTVVVTPTQSVYYVGVTAPNIISNDLSALGLNCTREARWELWVDYRATNALATTWDARMEWAGAAPDLSVTGLYRFACSSPCGQRIFACQTYPTPSAWQAGDLQEGAGSIVNTYGGYEIQLLQYSATNNYIMIKHPAPYASVVVKLQFWASTTGANRTNTQIYAQTGSQGDAVHFAAATNFVATICTGAASARYEPLVYVAPCVPISRGGASIRIDARRAYPVAAGDAGNLNIFFPYWRPANELELKAMKFVK